MRTHAHDLSLFLFLFNKRTPGYIHALLCSLLPLSSLLIVPRARPKTNQYSNRNANR